MPQAAIEGFSHLMQSKPIRNLDINGDALISLLKIPASIKFRLTSLRISIYSSQEVNYLASYLIN